MTADIRLWGFVGAILGVGGIDIFLIGIGFSSFVVILVTSLLFALVMTWGLTRNKNERVYVQLEEKK